LSTDAAKASVVLVHVLPLVRRFVGTVGACVSADVVLVVVDVEVVVVVVVDGGALVAPVTTSVGFDVVTAEPFLLLAVTSSRNV
jgi:hypothetical protein